MTFEELMDRNDADRELLTLIRSKNEFDRAMKDEDVEEMKNIFEALWLLVFDEIDDAKASIEVWAFASKAYREVRFH